MRVMRNDQLKLFNRMLEVMKEESLNKMFLETGSEAVDFESGLKWMPVIRINAIVGVHEFCDTRVGFDNEQQAFNHANSLLDRFHSWSGTYL